MRLSSVLDRMSERYNIFPPEFRGYLLVNVLPETHTINVPELLSHARAKTTGNDLFNNPTVFDPVLDGGPCILTWLPGLLKNWGRSGLSGCNPHPPLKRPHRSLAETKHIIHTTLYLRQRPRRQTLQHEQAKVKSQQLWIFSQSKGLCV